MAVRARDAGIEVVYEGIRLTAEEIAVAAEEEGVHVVGLSILSGSHLELVAETVKALADQGAEVALFVGGTIPQTDHAALAAAGAAGVFTAEMKVADVVAAVAETLAK